MDASQYPYAAQPPEPEEVAALGTSSTDEGLDPQTVTALSWLAGLLILFAFGNLVCFSVIESATPTSPAIWVALALFGLLPAQACIVPAAMVFAPGHVLLRALVGWAVALLLCGAWIGGAVICAWRISYPSSISSYDWETIAAGTWGVLHWLPAALLALQSPLWLLKLYCGWAVVRTSAGGSRDQPARPLAISDYLLAMGVVGLALALARWHLAGESVNAEDFWIPILVIGPGGAVLCLLGTAAPMLLVLLPDDSRQVLLRLAWLATGGVLLITLPFVVQVVSGWDVVFIEWSAGLMFFAAGCTALAACAGIIRHAGYRLQIGRRKRVSPAGEQGTLGK
jgi:hypothetical protein